MNIKEIHKQFADDHSPSVEGQIRWLQKQGFAQHQIEQAMITVYSEIERGEVPLVWHMREPDTSGHVKDTYCYTEVNGVPPGSKFKNPKPISNGHQLDQYLLEVARRIRTGELSMMVSHMEQFEAKLKAKWEADIKKKDSPKGERKGFLKKLFSSENRWQP